MSLYKKLRNRLVYKNALCDFHLAHRKGNGQNALLLGGGTVAGTKKVRYLHSELYIVL